ncbi:YesL family protein [Salibacterium lacus]|uniref:YesL family protein n=1 Tax=Salibacterium lacus TaxID=1898109 RepID=A0ABW5T3Q1_9BACI
MNNGTGFMGGFYAISEWIMRFSVANLYWVLFNVPIGLLLLSLLYIEESAGSALYLTAPLVLLVPVLFFPATTALFAQAREWVREEEYTGGCSRSYVGYYKENYKTSFIGGIVFVIIWGVLIADIYYFSSHNEALMYLFMIMGILLFVWTVNYFSVAVHYEMTFFGGLKHAFLITIGSPLVFLAVALSCGVILYISLYVFPLIIPLFTGSLVAFLSFSAFYRLHRKLAG